MIPFWHPGFYRKGWTCIKASPKKNGYTATGSPPATYEGKYHIT